MIGDIINEWNSMEPEAQYRFCSNCVKRAIKNGRSLKPGYDLDDAIQSTFAAVLERMQTPNQQADSLAAFICRAANAVMEGIAYRSTRDSKVISGEVITANGEELDIMADIAAADDTETSAIIRTMSESFNTSRDTIDKVIIHGLIGGYMEREIAAKIGISNVAVHKRIVRMRNTLKAIA